jgi:hypothetical protein
LITVRLVLAPMFLRLADIAAVFVAI